MSPLSARRAAAPSAPSVMPEASAATVVAGREAGCTASSSISGWRDTASDEASSMSV